MFINIIEYPMILQSFLDKYKLMINHTLKPNEIQWMKRDIIYTRLYRKFAFYNLAKDIILKGKDAYKILKRWNDENLEEMTILIQDNEQEQLLGKRKRHIKDVDIWGNFTNPIYDSYILNTLYDSDFIYDTDDDEGKENFRSQSDSDTDSLASSPSTENESVDDLISTFDTFTFKNTKRKRNLPFGLHEAFKTLEISTTTTTTTTIRYN